MPALTICYREVAEHLTVAQLHEILSEAPNTPRDEATLSDLIDLCLAECPVSHTMHEYSDDERCLRCRAQHCKVCYIFAYMIFN